MEIWKGNPRKKEELWLFPGVHEYPFTYALPIDLPESMDDSRYAKINYTVKVIGTTIGVIMFDKKCIELILCSIIDKIIRHKYILCMES